jgi:hypothetical protein
MSSEDKVPDRPTVALAYLLPVAQLCLCLSVAVLAIPNLGSQIRAATHPATAIMHDGGGEAGKSAAEDKAHWDVSACQLIWLTNMPGMWAEVATSRHTWPYSWFPPGFADLDTWRALLWPFAALPFWFCAGRGMDFFLHRSHAPPRIGAVTFLLALLVALFGAMIVRIGLSAGKAAAQPPPALSRALLGAGACWFVLGAVCCAAWVVQVVRGRSSRLAADMAGATD